MFFIHFCCCCFLMMCTFDFQIISENDKNCENIVAVDNCLQIRDELMT